MATLYASSGAELGFYSVDAERAALSQFGLVTLPGNVQEAWPHPSKPFLYVAWSTRVLSSTPRSLAAPPEPSSPAVDAHGITAFRIDPGSGALEQHGEPVALPARPVFITVDGPGEHMLTAYPEPSGLTVHRINPDGTLGAEVKQPAGLDTGTYSHQVRVIPDNQRVILVTRGNAPSATRKEDPGALKLFGYKNGVLLNQTSIAPKGGYGFQARHLDFHPTRPWFFLSLEEQNLLQVYSMPPGEALFAKETLDRMDGRPRHALGTVRVHPRGHVVYTANRCHVADESGRIRPGGENTIVVFRIDQQTGEPVRVQNEDTRGVTPRTFSLDPSGRVLVVGNQAALGDVPASLALFRVMEDGTLEFARKYDVPTGPGTSLFWSGIVSGLGGL